MPNSPANDEEDEDAWQERELNETLDPIWKFRLG